MTDNVTDIEEKRAIARLKRGDLDGLEIFVQRYQALAVRAAYLIVRDLKLAEDVVQDAFLRAAEKIEQFDERRSFAPWFLRIMINASIKAVKRQQRLLPLEGEPDDQVSRMSTWLQDPQPGPPDIVETAEIHRIVWSAMARLSAEQRAAVIMCHFLDMHELEIADKLDHPITTIHWWLRTARDRLREMLHPYWQSESGETREKDQR